jgi:flagellar motor switch protein FliN
VNPDSPPHDPSATDRAAIERWLFDEFSSRLTASLEAMTGTHPAVSWEAAAAPAAGGLQWRQPLNPLAGAMWVIAAEDAWVGVGRQILTAAGIEESEPLEQKSTYTETLNQALSGVAQSLTARLKSEVTCANGQELTELPAGADWAAVRIAEGESVLTVYCGLETALPGSLVIAPQEPAPPAETRAVARTAVDDSQTFDLLLDVELPVSVSFGRAQVPLKDVLKLTTGSIVELDRAMVEPVDIMVNNCVIARGEVVVVEGNFGVRIHHVISREERLRTFQ